MKLKNLLYATVGSAVLAFSTASCSDYLDISGEFNASWESIKFGTMQPIPETGTGSSTAI